MGIPHAAGAPLGAVPFTRQQAVAAGLTDDQLRARRWRQVFRGVWVDAAVPDTRELRLDAARLVIPQHGVLCGLTAAWVHGIDVRRLDDLDVHVGFAKGKRIRRRPGLSVCQESLGELDITETNGIRMTTAVRTAFDCLRWLHRMEAVVVADAMLQAGIIRVDDLQQYFAGQRRLRNLRVGRRLLDELVDGRSESPMETRLRLLLVDAGLPRPEAQWEVRDAAGGILARLDLAYPEQRVGVEYDGAFHWVQRRHDDRRRAAIRAHGWDVLVFSSDDVFRTPLATAAAVAAALRARRV